MTKFIFIRHGQTQTNIENRFAGQIETPLTKDGERQAELLCGWIAENYKVDRIYTSSLSRAYKTALPYANRFNIKINENDNLKEVNAGKWQGRKYVDIKEEYPEEFSIWKNDIGNAQLPGGESVREVSKRVVSEIIKLGERHPDETIMIVSHGVALRAMMAVFLKGDVCHAQELAWVPNASVSVANYENSKIEFEVIGFNDYLGDIKSYIPSNLI